LRPSASHQAIGSRPPPLGTEMTLLEVLVLLWKGERG
jgi:hypothetical protein